MIATRLLALALVASMAGTASAAPPAGAAARHPLAFRTIPPAPYALADSADSLYRVARKALDAGDYGHAADLFRRIADQYPSSQYAADAFYWRAFALYRRGGTDDLHQALASLAEQSRAHPAAATHGDAAALATRIRGELARRGDPAAAESIAVAARGAEQACPSEDDDMRAAALNALMQMDASEALPILRKVLARRDECSEPLRRKAVFLVAQKAGDESANILINVARTDPSPDVRGQAVFWLGQISGDRAVSLLDSVIRGTHDDDLQRKAIFALSQQERPRADTILRDLVMRPDVSEDVKAQAIFALGQARQRGANGAYLRELYPKLTSERLKDQVLMSIAQSEGVEGRQWLMDIALDPHQSMDARKKALFWAGQSGMSVAEFDSLYDRVTDQELKEQVIFVLAQNRNRAATDKLIDIARHDPNHELRKKAIFWLGQRDDPRVRQLLEELIDNDSH